MQKQAARQPQTILITSTIGVAGFVMGAVSIAGFMEGLDVALAVGACTAVISIPLAEVSLRVIANKPSLAAFVCIGLGYLFGTVNTAISFIVVSAIQENQEALSSVLGLSIIAGICGFFTGGPLGLVISGCYAVLIYLTHRLSRDGSHEVIYHLVARCGGWLNGVGALCLAGAYAVRSLGGSQAASFDALAQMSLALLLIGGMTFVGGLLCIGWRRRWLARIRRGQVSGWTVLPLDELGGDGQELRPLIFSPRPLREALVRRSTTISQGAYRSGELLEPVALV